MIYSHGGFDNNGAIIGPRSTRHSNPEEHATYYFTTFSKELLVQVMTVFIILCLLPVEKAWQSPVLIEFIIEEVRTRLKKNFQKITVIDIQLQHKGGHSWTPQEDSFSPVCSCEGWSISKGAHDHVSCETLVGLGFCRLDMVRLQHT